MKPDTSTRRARVQRLAAKRPADLSIDVELVRREIDDAPRRRKLVTLLASLLAPDRKP